MKEIYKTTEKRLSDVRIFLDLQRKISERIIFSILFFFFFIRLVSDSPIQKLTLELISVENLRRLETLFIDLRDMASHHQVLNFYPYRFYFRIFDNSHERIRIFSEDYLSAILPFFRWAVSYNNFLHDAQGLNKNRIRQDSSFSVNAKYHQDRDALEDFYLQFTNSELSSYGYFSSHL